MICFRLFLWAKASYTELKKHIQIIYNYSIGKFREFYFSKGSKDQNLVKGNTW